MHKMKGSTLLLLTAFISLFLLNSCNDYFKSNSFRIEGTLKGYNQSKLLLEEVVLGEATLIDTVKTNAAGEFELKGTVKEPGIYRISTEQGLSFILILKAGSQIIFEADVAKPLPYKMSGETECEALRSYIDSQITRNLRLRQMQEDYYALRNNGGNDSILKVRKAGIALAENSLIERVRQYVDTSHYYLVSLFAASNLRVEADFARKKTLLAKMEKAMPNSAYTKSFKSILGTVVEDPVGEKFKDFQLPNLERRMVKLSDVKAKLILLDFWASWCKPCRAEHPAMIQLYQKYKSSGMTIFSVSIDEEAGRWFDAVQEDKLMWPNHVNEIDGLKGVSCMAYYINEIPNNYLIDSNGIVIARNLHGQALQDFVANYFNK